MKTKSNDLIGFSDFKIPIMKIPKIKSVRNFFGEAIYYREIENVSDTLVVIVHGMGGDSRYLTQFGIQVAQQTKHHVVLPDLKFHGEMNQEKAVRLGPQEDVVFDLDFLTKHMMQKTGFTKVVLVGHSLGGAVVLKWLLSKENGFFQKIVLISPYLPDPYNVESTQFSLWLKRFQDGRLQLQFPEQAKWGSEVEEYDASYIRSCLPDHLNWENCLQKCEDLTVVVSEADQILDVNKYRAYLSEQNKIKFFVLPNLSHIGLVTSSASGQKIAELVF